MDNKQKQYEYLVGRLFVIEQKIDKITRSSLDDAKRDAVVAAVKEWMKTPYYNKEGAWEEVIDAMNAL